MCDSLMYIIVGILCGKNGNTSMEKQHVYKTVLRVTPRLIIYNYNINDRTYFLLILNCSGRHGL